MIWNIFKKRKPEIVIDHYRDVNLTEAAKLKEYFNLERRKDLVNEYLAKIERKLRDEVQEGGSYIYANVPISVINDIVMICKSKGYTIMVGEEYSDKVTIYIKWEY